MYKDYGDGPESQFGQPWLQRASVRSLPRFSLLSYVIELLKDTTSVGLDLHRDSTHLRLPPGILEAPPLSIERLNAELEEWIPEWS